MSRSASTAAVYICTLLAATGVAFGRDLTFEERVKAQEAIERVYYSHQIGSTRPFDEAVPRRLLERKVKTYLKESFALEKFWHTTMTAEMLQGELSRMARQTRMPDRLSELFSVLGDDSFLIQECLARPALVDRLVHSFFALDQDIHSEARREAETLRTAVVIGQVNPFSDHPNRTVLEFVRVGDVEAGWGHGEISWKASMQSPGRVEVASSDFERLKESLPEHVDEMGPVREEKEGFSFRVILEKHPSMIRIAVFSIRKISWDTWWEQVQAGLDENSVAQVASSIIPLNLPLTVPGREWSLRGPGIGETSSGQALGPPACADDTWNNASLDDLPDARDAHTAVWTGSMMLVWGGTNGAFPLKSGGRYDPVTDTWTSISSVNAPTPRYFHSAVWSGNVMIVWGGYDGTYLNSGGRYDPGSDTWLPTATNGMPSARSEHTAIWTGSLMVIWGGYSGSYLNTGGRYDPVADLWMPTSMTNAPTARNLHAAVWTGSVMVVWGGSTTGMLLNSGGRYDPTSDIWLPTSTSNAPLPRELFSAVWTGALLVVWGGIDNAFPATYLATGGRYDPISDVWTPTSTANAPSGRSYHSAMWTSSGMIIWGGYDGTSDLTTGGRYSPQSDVWSLISSNNAPSGRTQFTAIWTGNLMVVWGGASQISPSRYVYLNSGARYDPASDSWTPTSLGTAPSGRTAPGIWTGTVMIVWGGSDNSGVLNTGARYDPATDTWKGTSTVNNPSARATPSVWTGNVMVVWGGVSLTGSLQTFFNSGGRYDPISDSWLPISLVNAPSARNAPVVWDGSVVIVWGGNDATAYLGSGARYDPAADSWAPMSSVNAPTPRSAPLVWTGKLMVVWGGAGGALAGC